MAKSEPATASINVPVLGYTRQLPGDDGPDRLVIGFDGLTLDGRPFPYATAGDWVLTFVEDGVAVLNVPIVVTLPQDPAAEDVGVAPINVPMGVLGGDDA